MSRRSRALVALAALVLGPAANAAEVEVRPLIIFAHASDPTDSGASESESDFLGAGASVRFRDLEVAGALGRYARECGALRGGPCPSRPGGFVSLRWTPRLRRR